MSVRGLGGCALTLVIGFAVLVVIVWLLQRRMIYIPFPATLPPIERALPGGRDAVVETTDGLALGAWFLPARPGPARGAVLVLPGNAGNRSLRTDLARALAVRDVDVLLVDYRGYAGNAGAPTERGVIEDARAARRWLESNGTDAERIVYFGESLGAAVAVALAVEHPPAGLVLRSPFSSLVEVGRRHYPILPVALLMRDRFSSIDRIAEVDAPLLVVLGERDAIVPPAMSRKLHAAAREPKRLVAIEGVGHNDYELLAGERMMAEVGRLLDDVLPPL